MGIITFPPASGPKIDISALSEHQATNLNVISPSLITLMSVTGSGALEQAIIGWTTGTGTWFSTFPHIIITIDGIVVFDVIENVNNFGFICLGITSNSSIFNNPTNTNLSIYGIDSSFSPQISSTIIFPSNTSQSVGSVGVIGLDFPIYFNSSLLVQVSGVPTSSGPIIKAYAKARY